MDRITGRGLFLAPWDEMGKKFRKQQPIETRDLQNKKTQTYHEEKRLIVLKTLGSGAFGEASLVQTETGDFQVMKKSHERDGRSLKRQFVHMKMAHTLSPEFIQPYTLNLRNKDPYFTMEYLEGYVPLDYFFRSNGQFGPVSLSLRETMVRQLFYLVQTLHNFGMVHKDIKPSNIMIHPLKAQLRLIDFGFAQSDKKPMRFSGTYIYSGPHIFKKCTFDEKAKRTTSKSRFGFEEFVRNDLWGTYMVSSMLLHPSYHNPVFLSQKPYKTAKELQFKLFQLYTADPVTTALLTKQMITTLSKICPSVLA